MRETYPQKGGEENMPLISVIMGVYNGEKTLRLAIDSIIKQTYSNWELIICDDCSTDSTIDILEEYRVREGRIHILHNKTNQRLAAALNHCLKKAKGEYIARMDADDESLPNRLATQAVFLETHPEYACVGSGVIVFDDDGNQYIRSRKEFPQKRDLLWDVPFTHPTILMRKSVYDALGGYTVSKMTVRAEDLDLWFRFYAQGYQGYNIKKPLYRYRESLEDYKKRTLSAGFQTARVFLNGYRLLELPPYLKVFGLKPIITSIIPNPIMKYYHFLRK